MKKFLTILILILVLQNPSQADEISDFQIEGISIWDSALKHFSKEKITNSKQPYYQYVKKNKNMFSTSEISGNYETYDVIQFSYKTNDPKYKIYYIAGMISYKNNVEDCYKKKSEVEKDLKILFPDLRTSETYKKKHRADPTGESFTTSKVFYYPNNSYIIAVRCFDWSPQSNRTDHLRINIKSKQFNDWISEK
tara:strand:+ start:270 stop:851 length:582 start_codon:yes stop_codon:yes gene_type:complete